MPKSDPDRELQKAAQMAIREHRSIEKAAHVVGLSPATLWRVAKSGRAIPRTRSALEAWRSTSSLNEINKTGPLVEFTVSREELLQTRRMLMTLLQVLDQCINAPLEAAAPSRENMK
ncbi:hypothetical protein ACFJGX_23070 [Hydrogenophaga sp. UC242_50]|uniref:hypothetical protein n=1 Tax=unclassified Hydrogenophaga TaxID=2610897 RepID=UPI0036D4292B